MVLGVKISTKMANDLAHHLNKTPGMVWKIWTENSRTGIAAVFTCSLMKAMRTTS